MYYKLLYYYYYFLIIKINVFNSAIIFLIRTINCIDMSLKNKRLTFFRNTWFIRLPVNKRVLKLIMKQFVVVNLSTFLKIIENEIQ